ncbi:MAG: hypothetical protein HAW66_07865 [Shewanella sp.]|nr:hypothetical protein [Shewanella sp.]
MGISIERIRTHINDDMCCLKETIESNVFVLTLPNSKHYRIVSNILHLNVSVEPIDENGEAVPSSIRSRISCFCKNDNSTKIKRIIESKENPNLFLREKGLERNRIQYKCKSEAGDRINRAIRAYLHLKRQKIASAKSLREAEKQLPLHQRSNPLGFITMRHNTKMNWRGEPRLYYVDIDGRLKTKRDPDRVNNNGAAGSFKQVIAEDCFAIELAPKKVMKKNRRGNEVEVQGDDFDLESAFINNCILKELSVYSSICQTVTVSARRMIGENGGVEVFESYLQNDYCVELKYCEQLCADIADAHLKGIFFRDIKTENIVLQEFKKGIYPKIRLEKPMIQMIDTDLVVTRQYGDKGLNCGTLGNMTEGLINIRVYADQAVREAKNQSDRARARASAMLDNVEKAFDNYALIISLFEMTEPDGSRQVTGMALLDRGADYPPRHGFLTLCSKPYIFNDWVDKYVKKQYQNAVRNFMREPSGHPLQYSVNEIIDWNMTDTQSEML